MIKVGYIDEWSIDEYYLTASYEKQPLKNTEIDTWKKQGYYHKSFSGHLYSSKNYMPNWVVEASDKIGLKHCGYTFYRMDQLDIMPPHQDHFETYCKIFNQLKENTYRAIVFLENWKPGHYFEYDSIGLVNWKRGDYVLYSEEVFHAASNIGIEPRYTLQITGVL